MSKCPAYDGKYQDIHDYAKARDRRCEMCEIHTDPAVVAAENARMFRAEVAR